MFNFFKKKNADGDFKLMFDLNVLDKAFEKAVSDYEETGIAAAKLCGASESEARQLVALDIMRIKTFTIQVKNSLLKEGELK